MRSLLVTTFTILTASGCVASTPDAPDEKDPSPIPSTVQPRLAKPNDFERCADPTGIVLGPGVDVCVDPFPNPPTGIVADDMVVEDDLTAKEPR